MTEMYRLYDKMINNIQKKEDFSLMGPMHTILAGLKALFCHISYEGVKIMRECCGANGFSKYSSFHALIASCSPGVTLEGDSVVMNLQTARALLKNGRQVLIKNKPLNKTVSYIEELKTLDPNVCCAAADGDRLFFSNEQNLVNLLKHSALLAISNCL